MRFGKNSLKAKILLLIVVLALMWSAFWVYSYMDHYNEAIKAEKDKAARVANLLGGLSSFALLSLDYSLLDPIMARTMAQENVLKIKIVDREGKTLRENSKEKMEKHSIEIREPIKLGEELLGDVIVVFSTEKTHSRLMKNVKLSVLVVLIGLTVSCFLFVFFLKRLIITPLDNINNSMKEVKKGNLAVSIQSNFSDEIKTLAEGLNSVVENLKSTVSRSFSAAYSVGLSADRVSRSSGKIALFAQEEASATEETSASMEQMAGSVSRTAKSAVDLAANVSETSATINEMAASIEQVGKNTDGMAASVEETSATVEEMLASIEQSSKN
ncbi:MAG TPA: methyl-accepting chemotaxis protein, partial [Thermodesulfovibrionales bacterium]|nr:methyl-accepting chemotaxis protein [Thermodesulfovibrionales bacterium]